MLRRSLKHLKTLYELKNGESHDEYQYIQLIKDIQEEGIMEYGRNGNAKTIIGSAMHFSLEDNIIPLLTTKTLAWKTCLKELLWFIAGKTDNKILKEQNVGIWNENASREFLDSRGLFERNEDDLGPIYGHQWRYFNAPYSSCNDDYSGKGVDQLKYIIDSLKNPEIRNSRRLIMTAWNPCQIDDMALPPCHIIVQFNVTDKDKLSCSLYQRSGDVGLGVPFNIASYSFLTHLIAKHCDLKAFEFIYHLGNCHIYDNHLDILNKQVIRKPFPFPTLNIKTIRNSIDKYSLDDFEIINYKSHGRIKMEMRK
jgi:thymidylate synthase